MAYSYTNGGITFNNLPVFDKTTMKKYLQLHMGNNDYSVAQEDGVVPFVNAVEIDWNGAQLGE